MEKQEHNFPCNSRNDHVKVVVLRSEFAELGLLTALRQRLELLLLLLLLFLLLTAIQLSLGGSSPYTSTDKTNKNKYRIY